MIFSNKIKYKVFTFITFLFLLYGGCNFGPEQKEPEHQINYEPNAVLKIDDNTYISSWTFTDTKNSIYRSHLLLKFNDQGVKLWAKNHGNGEGYKIIRLTNGNYIIVGRVYYSQNMFILLVDEEGNEIWRKTYSFAEDGRTIAYIAYDVIEISNGDIIVAGTIFYSFFFNIFNSDFLFIKLDAEGNLLAYKKYNWGSDDGVERAIVKSHDGQNYITIGGNSILKIDSNLVILWRKEIDRTQYPALSLSAIAKTSEGYIIAGAYGVANESKLYISKINDEGDILWSMSYNSFCCPKYIKVENDGFIIAGGFLFGSYYTVYVLKLNMDGNELWKREFSFESLGSDFAFESSPEGSYIVLMDGSVNGPRLVKLDKSGNVIYDGFIR